MCPGREPSLQRQQSVASFRKLNPTPHYVISWLQDKFNLLPPRVIAVKVKALIGIVWLGLETCKRTPSSHQAENQGTVWFSQASNFRENSGAALAPLPHGCLGTMTIYHLSPVPKTNSYVSPSELVSSVGLQHLTGWSAGMEGSRWLHSCLALVSGSDGSSCFFMWLLISSRMRTSSHHSE